MALPDTVNGQYFTVMWGDGSGPPEVFTAFCGLRTRNLNIQVNTADEFDQDCADPTAVPVRVLNITGKQFDITGTGTWNRADADTIRSLIGIENTYRFVQDEPATDTIDDGYWEGEFVLTQVGIEATDGSKVSANLTFASTGDVVWTDA